MSENGVEIRVDRPQPCEPGLTPDQYKLLTSLDDAVLLRELSRRGRTAYVDASDVTMAHNERAFGAEPAFLETITNALGRRIGYEIARQSTLRALATRKERPMYGLPEDLDVRRTMTVLVVKPK